LGSSRDNTALLPTRHCMVGPAPVHGPRCRRFSPLSDLVAVVRPWCPGIANSTSVHDSLRFVLRVFPRSSPAAVGSRGSRGLRVDPNSLLQFVTVSRDLSQLSLVVVSQKSGPLAVLGNRGILLAMVDDGKRRSSADGAMNNQWPWKGKWKACGTRLRRPEISRLHSSGTVCPRPVKHRSERSST